MNANANAKWPGHLIRRLHQKSTQVFTQRVREAGHAMTPVQFAVLHALDQAPGTDQASLSHLVAKDPATTGAVIDRLVQAGLIRRTVSSADRRARVLELSAQGQGVLATLRPVVEALQREVLEGLDEAEYATFLRLAAKAASLSAPPGEDA